MCGLDLILICVSGMRISLSGYLFSIGFSQCLDLDVKFKQDKLCEIHRMWRKTGIDVEIQLN